MRMKAGLVGSRMKIMKSSEPTKHIISISIPSECSSALRKTAPASKKSP